MPSITLVKYGKEDFEDYFTMVKQDNVMRYITGKGLNKEQALAKFRSILEINNDADHIGYFKVFSEQNKLIGDCKLVWYHRDPDKLEIGYLLVEEYWRKGFGTMICENLLAKAKRLHPTSDVVGIIDPENIASKRLLEKFGFQRFFIGVEQGLKTEKLILKQASTV